ncbi:MAG TPA: GTPase [Candidatus Deferrimicrobium sp.]|nr:GTPase [Candidatus Deferrimicrobium sp.]
MYLRKAKEFVRNMSHLWEVINNVISDANLILVVLDARDPLGTRSPQIEKMILNQPDKKLLLLLNKIDLIPKDITLKWQKILDNEFPTLIISATRGFERTLRLLRKKILQFAPSLPAYVAVVGFTNVGKSTIINGLKGTKIVGTSPHAGFTRGKQYVNLSDDIRLIDSPGIIPFEGDELELALKDLITPEKIQNVEAVVKEIISRIGMSKVSYIYKIQFTNLDELLENLAKRRGLLMAGGEPNTYEAAKVVIRDWQRGHLPFYTLPPSE